jgi:putative FmdB family regulatory protein
LPTYEYACTSCAHRLEAVQSFTDDPLTECPECGAALRKVYGAVGIVLKGSGFYKNDSRAASAGNGSGKKTADSSSGDGPSGDGSSGESSGGESSSSNGSSSDSSSKKEPASDKGGGSGTGGSEKTSSSKDTAPASSTAS